MFKFLTPWTNAIANLGGTVESLTDYVQIQATAASIEAVNELDIAEDFDEKLEKYNAIKDKLRNRNNTTSTKKASK